MKNSGFAMGLLISFYIIHQLKEKRAVLKKEQQEVVYI